MKNKKYLDKKRQIEFRKSGKKIMIKISSPFQKSPDSQFQTVFNMVDHAPLTDSSPHTSPSSPSQVACFSLKSPWLTNL